MNDLSVYIHIPFCLKKCHYCDFSSFDNNMEKIDEYVKVLVSEIKDFDFTNYTLKSIFFGGGTPSLLAPRHIKDILRFIPYNEKVEITMECNPETLSYNYLKEIYDMGINRLSIGLQSANNEVLKFIGRIHTFEKFLENYNYAREVGFKNINIDVMFSLPNLTKDEYLKDLEKIANLNPNHLSVYSLIIEEETKFYTMVEEGIFNLNTDEEDREIFELSENILKKYGYNKYEISNYEKGNMECIHNLGYWELREYIGFGLSAHSFINNKRFQNTDNLDEYLKGATYINVVEVSKSNLIEEFIFLGLRKTEGICTKDFEKKFNCTIFEIYKSVIDKLTEDKYILFENNRIKLTKKAINISNKILSEFIL